MTPRNDNLTTETLTNLGDVLNELSSVNYHGQLAQPIIAGWALYGQIHYYLNIAEEDELPIPAAMMLFDAEQHTENLKRLHSQIVSI